MGKYSIESLGEATYDSPIDFELNRYVAADNKRTYVDPHILVDKPNGHYGEDIEDYTFEVAGPREKVFFKGDSVKAAIVSCGGLCPGINSVIRSLVLQLWNRYNCRNIVGIKYGYNGMDINGEEIRLTPQDVQNIHNDGGTILGTSRGNPGVEKMVDFLQKEKIDMLFTIGGDGTLTGAHFLHEEVKKRKLDIAIIGIPKTIDNDIALVRKSFGFETAVAKATEAIHSAFNEAVSQKRGIGLVKLMGRNAGFIAATASLAANTVDFCLIPEVKFGLQGPKGLFNQIDNHLKNKNFAVIVVAEGAGQEFFQGIEEKFDGSGNKKLNDIGIYLKNQIIEHFKNLGDPVNLKYIDPSYIIRSSVAISSDQLLCARLAQDAVHAAMAGKTGLYIGYWHGQSTHMPLKTLLGKKRNINPNGELWFNVLETTGQGKLSANS